MLPPIITDNILHGVTNAGNYRVPERMFDGITDHVINQVEVSKTSQAGRDHDGDQ